MTLLRYVHSVFGFWFVFIAHIHFDNCEIYDNDYNMYTVTIPHIYEKSQYDEVRDRLSRFTLKRISKAPKDLGIEVQGISQESEIVTEKERETKAARMSPEMTVRSPQMMPIYENERNENDLDTLNNYDYDDQTFKTDQIRKVLNKQVQLITNFFQIMNNKDDKRPRKRHRDMLRDNNDNGTTTKSPAEKAKDELFATFNLTSEEEVDKQSHPVNLMMVSQGAVKNALKKDQLVQRLLKIYKEKRSDYLKRKQQNS